MTRAALEKDVAKGDRGGFWYAVRKLLDGLKIEGIPIPPHNSSLTPTKRGGNVTTDVEQL